MNQYDKSEFCDECLATMERDFNQHGVHCGNKSYGNPLISESLGIHPEQAAEHRKNHPNIEVMPEGQLRFNNYQDHKNYLNKIAWDKKESKRKRISK
jgi:hypothetical protein